MIIYVERIKLDRQGYTKRGEYYGVGAPLWLGDANEDNGLHITTVVVRAANKKAARVAIDKELTRKGY